MHVEELEDGVRNSPKPVSVWSRRILAAYCFLIGAIYLAGTPVLLWLAFFFTMLGGTGTLGRDQPWFFALAFLFAVLSIVVLVIGLATIAGSINVWQGETEMVKTVGVINVIFFPLGTCLYFLLRRYLSGRARIEEPAQTLVKQPQQPRQ